MLNLWISRERLNLTMIIVKQYYHYIKNVLENKQNQISSQAQYYALLPYFHKHVNQQNKSTNY